MRRVLVLGVLAATLAVGGWTTAAQAGCGGFGGGYGFRGGYGGGMGYPAPYGVGVGFGRPMGYGGGWGYGHCGPRVVPRPVYGPQIGFGYGSPYGGIGIGMYGRPF